MPELNRFVIKDIELVRMPKMCLKFMERGHYYLAGYPDLGIAIDNADKVRIYRDERNSQTVFEVTTKEAHRCPIH